MKENIKIDEEKERKKGNPFWHNPYKRIVE